MVADQKEVIDKEVEEDLKKSQAIASELMDLEVQLQLKLETKDKYSNRLTAKKLLKN